MAKVSYPKTSVVAPDLLSGVQPSLLSYVFPQSDANVPAPVGDGNSHLLSAYYATLAEAQVNYPHATALTDELAWASLQSAINNLKDGQTLLIPEGRYRLNKKLTLLPGVRLSGNSAKRPDTAALSGAFGVQLIGSGITFVEISNPSGSYSGGDTVLDSLIFTDLTGHDDTIMVDVIGYLGGVEINDCVFRAPTLSAGVGIRGKGIGLRFTSADNFFVNRCRVYGFNRGVVMRASSAVPCTSFSFNDCLIVGNNINVESPYESGAVGVGNGLIKGGAIQFPWDANLEVKANSLTLSGVHIENFKTQLVGAELRKGLGLRVLSGTVVTQGCDFYQPPQDETFAGNGAAREFTLAYNQIAEPLIYVNDVQDTSVKLDDAGGAVTGAHWYWLSGGKRIRQDTSEAVLTGADVLRVIYPDEYCRSVDVGYAAVGNLIYNSISDQFVGCIASANPTPVVLVHPRQATAYNPYLFLQDGATIVRHDVDGIGGPASQDRTYNIEALETRHAARAGGETLISLQKKGDLSADNIRYALSHRSNGQDLYLYTQDSDGLTPTFYNWLKFIYSTRHVQVAQFLEALDQLKCVGAAEFDATVSVLADAMLQRGTAGNLTQIQMDKGAVASPTNLQYFLSHRANGKDWYLTSDDGTVWINWVICDAVNGLLKFGQPVRITSLAGGGDTPARIDGNGQVGRGKISVTSANDVEVSGLTDGALVKRSGTVLASVSAFTANRVLIADGTGAIAVLSAMTASLPMMTAGDGLPTTTSWGNVYTNIKTDIDADFVSNTDLATNVYTKSEIDTMLAGYATTAALASKSDMGHNHGYSGTTGVTSGHDHSYSGTAT